MALCKICQKSVIPCAGPDGKKCFLCSNKLDNPANEICENCSQEKNYCEHCGKRIKATYEVISLDSITSKHSICSFETETDESAIGFFNENFAYKYKSKLWPRFMLMKLMGDGGKSCIAHDCS